MADTKISALPLATTPLAGTEVLPIVQSSATKQVSVGNLTTGRDVTTKKIIAVVGSETGTAASFYAGAGFSGAHNIALKIGRDGTNAAREVEIRYTSGTFGQYPVMVLGAGGTDVFSVSYTSDAKLISGNLVIGTSGKGIDFSASSHAAGMTSQLLNWYEEGTWTPNQGGGLTVVGAFSSSGKYTRIGRQVTVIGSVSGATSIAVNANSQISTNLPFATSVLGLGSAMNNAGTAFSTVYVATSTIYSASAIGATTTISFQCTYFV